MHRICLKDNSYATPQEKESSSPKKRPCVSKACITWFFMPTRCGALCLSDSSLKGYFITYLIYFFTFLSSLNRDNILMTYGYCQMRWRNSKAILHQVMEVYSLLWSPRIQIHRDALRLERTFWSFNSLARQLIYHPNNWISYQQL